MIAFSLLLGLLPIPSSVSTILSKYRITGLLGSSKLRAWIILTPFTLVRWNWDRDKNGSDGMNGWGQTDSAYEGEKIEEVPATHLPDVVCI